jgi:hypothetical protein
MRSCGKRLDILWTFTVFYISDAKDLNVSYLSTACLQEMAFFFFGGGGAIFVANFQSEDVSRLDHLSIINRLQAASTASAKTEKWTSLLCLCKRRECYTGLDIH